MWTETTRPKYERKGLRYASDLTEAEWGVIGPLLPPCKRLGRPRTTDLREVVNAILYMARTGCQWPMLPNSTFRRRARSRSTSIAWRTDATLNGINHELLIARARPRAESCQPVRRCDRQPVGENHGKRRPARVRRRQVGLRGASAISSPTPAGGSSRAWFTPPISRTATDTPPLQRQRSDGPSPGCATSSPMAPTPDRNSARRWKRSASGRWRSSSEATTSRASQVLPRR